jgi:hypothetical protein
VQSTHDPVLSSGLDDGIPSQAEEAVTGPESRRPRPRRRRAEKQEVIPDQPTQSVAPTSATDIPDLDAVDRTEEAIKFEEEEDNEPGIEVDIQRFVAKLQLNVPVLADTAIFATLFQQLFYEKWRSGALTRTRAALSSLRDLIKQRTSDEIASLRELVNANDLAVYLGREEKKLRLLEKMSVDTLERVLEKRATSYAAVKTQGLLRTFQGICGDHVTLQRKIREKRADIRGATLELRALQAKRIAKLQVYHERVALLESAASSQRKMKEALERHEEVENELTRAEEDRQALIRQKEKVQAMLSAKKAEIHGASKK